jgi:UDP-glucose 4-epimerase
MHTVLVTGGNGFIGQYVTEELLRRGYIVDVLDTRTERSKYGRTVLGDIRDATAVTEAVAHVDGVIHLAGVLGTQETINNPGPAAETNILGGLNVFQAVAQHKVPCVNIAVGNHWMNNTYSITKSTMERFAAMYNKDRGTEITVVRALNAYGPRQSVAAPYGPSKVRKIMPSFIHRAMNGHDIEIYGDGTQIMDMIYVSDVANILVKALERTAAFGHIPTVIEAGSGNRTTVNDIAAQVIMDVFNRTGKASEIVYLPMRPGEDEHSVVVGNTDTLELVGVNVLGLVPLAQGVSRTVDYYFGRK